MYEVRPFAERDRANVERIYRDCRLEASWLSATAKERSDFSRDTKGESLFVAVDGSDVPDGFVSVWEPDAFIHHLYVRRAVRGRGIGELLLDSLDGRLARPWRLKCLRANADAFAFYLNRRWKEVASGENEDGPFAILEKT